MKIYEKYLQEKIDWEKNQSDSKKLKKGAKVKILRGRHKGKIGKVVSWYDEESRLGKSEYAGIDVSVDGKIAYLGKDDVEWAENG
jgi:ribosomal protein S4E